jgi:glycosyltransferase involved in cell wall biosynthesis
MRVLFLAHSFPRQTGDAAGSFILRLASALRDEDVEAHVLAPAAPELPSSEVLEDVAVERFRYAPRRYETLAYTGNMAADVKASFTAKLALVSFLGANFAAAARARREIEPAVVHAHWWFPGGLVGSWLSGLAHLPLVTTLHGSDVRLARGTPVARTAFRRVVRHSAAVTAVSSWLAREARTMDDTREVEVAPMPVRTDLFAPSAGPRAANRFLFVGRLNAQKGIAHLIRALAIAKRGPELDVVGDGPDADALRTLAGSLGVGSRIRWHGALPHDLLPALYQQATALVLPSIDEGLGLVAVEAHLCGTPVIASESGGIPDVVQHERTGLLVPPSDPAALAMALDEILARDDHGAALGDAGRIHALGTFSPQAVGRRYAELYRRVVAEAPRPATG